MKNKLYERRSMSVVENSFHHETQIKNKSLQGRRSSLFSLGCSLRERSSSFCRWNPFYTLKILEWSVIHRFRFISFVRWSKVHDCSGRSSRRRLPAALLLASPVLLASSLQLLFVSVTIFVSVWLSLHITGFVCRPFWVSCWRRRGDRAGGGRGGGPRGRGKR